MSVKSKKRKSSGKEENDSIQKITESDEVEPSVKVQSSREESFEDKSERRKNRRKERRQMKRRGQKESKQEIPQKPAKEVSEDALGNQEKGDQKAKRKDSVAREEKLETFTKDDVQGVGHKQGRKYLAFSLIGLFIPPLAPVGWLLSASLRSLAKTSGYLLDNRVYAAWVIGLVATVFYLGFLLLLGGLYYLNPGYSLF